MATQIVTAMYEGHKSFKPASDGVNNSSVMGYLEMGWLA
jgi:hypothetical protein